MKARWESHGVGRKAISQPRAIRYSELLTCPRVRRRGLESMNGRFVRNVKRLNRNNGRPRPRPPARLNVHTAGPGVGRPRFLGATSRVNVS